MQPLSPEPRAPSARLQVSHHGGNLVMSIMLAAILIVLLFAALPTLPYRASGRSQFHRRLQYTIPRTIPHR